MLPPPRKWQREAFSLWNASRKGVVSVVTGGGKTLFALQCFASLPGDGWSLAVVVPTLALLDQWVVALECDMGIPLNEIGVFSGENSGTSGKRANVLVINTARRVIDSLTNSGRWMLVVDECHRAGSAENSHALVGKFEATLGLSATPQRQYDDGFARFVEPVLGPVIYEYSYHDAKSDGVIADFEARNVRFPLTQDEQEQYNQYSAAIHRVSALVQRTPTAELQARLRQMLIRRSGVTINALWRIPASLAAMRSVLGKALVFHERISAAEELARGLNQTDRRAAVYHSKVYGPTRRERLRLFRAGVYDTLVTCRSLDEGLNVPDASVAVISASTSSHRQRIQRMGRVLRASGGEKRAIVITLYATESEERELRDEQSRLEDVASIRWFEADLPK